MRVKCVICEKIDNLADDLPLAKRLRNRHIQTYMCNECHDRISEKTLARIETGKFILHKSSHPIEKDF